MQNKKVTERNGIQTQQFKQLNKVPCKVASGFWTLAFHTLFDTKQWKQYHLSTSEKAIVYINGHGSRRSTYEQSSEFVCGIPAFAFARLLHFFDTQLNIDRLGVQTCYWPSMRILELMAHRYDYKYAPFHIITPLRSENTLTISSSYWQPQDKPYQYSFFEALTMIMRTYQGEITPRIKAITQHIDTLKMPENNKQGITLTPSNSDLIHVV